LLDDFEIPSKIREREISSELEEIRSNERKEPMKS
jgi:hypothetical protein